MDGPAAGACDAVRVIFAGEKVRRDYPEAAPNLGDQEHVDEISTLNLDALVRMKLTSYWRKGQVHLLDMRPIEMIDESWLPRFSETLQQRLPDLIDDPDG